MVRNSAAITVCLAALLLATSLAAQEKGKRTAAELKQLNNDAFAAAGKGDLDKAVELWRDMVRYLEGQARWDIHANIAVAYRKMEKYPEAWHHLRLYMTNTSKGNVQAGKDLQLIEKKLEAKHFKVTINCDPAGAAKGGPDIYSYGGRAHSCPLQW